MPYFVKFSGGDSRTTLEHVGQFLLQCGDASSSDALCLRLFPLSLSGTAFTWFTSLAPNSVHTWAQLEQKFHEYFFTGDTELRLSHLTSVRQKHNESVAEYIRRFRDTRYRCYNLLLSAKSGRADNWAKNKMG
jgi:DNA-binding response OmpR family regulator